MLSFSSSFSGDTNVAVRAKKLTRRRLRFRLSFIANAGSTVILLPLLLCAVASSSFFVSSVGASSSSSPSSPGGDAASTMATTRGDDATTSDDSRRRDADTVEPAMAPSVSLAVAAEEEEEIPTGGAESLVGEAIMAAVNAVARKNALNDIENFVPSRCTGGFIDMDAIATAACPAVGEREVDLHLNYHLHT